MVKFISSQQTLAIRSAVLRAGLPPEDCVFPTDEVPGAFHLGCFSDHELVSVASFFPQHYKDRHDQGYQLRGMATLASFSGKGCGTQLLKFAIEQLKATNAVYLWCNARENAVPFYQRNGFEVVSAQFEIPGIGPHYEMIRVLSG